MKEYDGKNNVTIPGLVGDVRPYLDEATVVLAPVFEGGGMRTKVLEAWAMAKPVVGTKLSFEGLTYNNGDLGYVADESEEFARCASILLNSPDLARAMGDRARQCVESNFSWDSFAALYDRIYTDVLENRRPSGASGVNSTLEHTQAKELQEEH
jgi:glycosyltransferase involved in cell wall biosynthesis